MEENYEFSMETIVQKPSIYNILYSESLNKEKLYLHVRGTKLVFNNHPCIKNLIDELNKGEKTKVQSLMRILDGSWDQSIGFYILNSIYLHHGIRIY